MNRGRSALSLAALLGAGTLLVADSAWYDCVDWKGPTASYSTVATCQGEVVAEGTAEVVADDGPGAPVVESSGDVTVDIYAFAWNTDSCEGSTDPSEATGSGRLQELTLEARFRFAEADVVFFCDVDPGTTEAACTTDQAESPCTLDLVPE